MGCEARGGEGASGSRRRCWAWQLGFESRASDGHRLLTVPDGLRVNLKTVTAGRVGCFVALCMLCLVVQSLLAKLFTLPFGWVFLVTGLLTMVFGTVLGVGAALAMETALSLGTTLDQGRDGDQDDARHLSCVEPSVQGEWVVVALTEVVDLDCMRSHGGTSVEIMRSTPITRLQTVPKVLLYACSMVPLSFLLSVMVASTLRIANHLPLVGLRLLLGPPPFEAAVLECTMLQLGQKADSSALTMLSLIFDWACSATKTLKVAFGIVQVSRGRAGDRDPAGAQGNVDSAIVPGRIFGTYKLCDTVVPIGDRFRYYGTFSVRLLELGRRRLCDKVNINTYKFNRSDTTGGAGTEL
ncbi:unnamed protein product, partial [Prorocentrum cordatum]